MRVGWVTGRCTSHRQDIAVASGQRRANRRRRNLLRNSLIKLNSTVFVSRRSYAVKTCDRLLSVAAGLNSR